MGRLQQAHELTEPACVLDEMLGLTARHGRLPCRPRMSAAAETTAVAVTGKVLAMAAGRRLFPMALPAGNPAQGGTYQACPKKAHLRSRWYRS